MFLTIGDKVRVLDTQEAGEIIAVIDEHHAKIETFDEVITLHLNEVLPFSATCGYVCETVKRFVPKEATVSEPMEKSIKTEFITSIDLHAEQLMQHPEKKSPEEILSIQLSRLNSFLNQAIPAKTKELTIVHGKGSGRLKAEVELVLHKHPSVKSFKVNDDFFKPNKGETIVQLS